MKLIEVKKDEVVNSSRNEYNPKEWSKKVESYSKMNNVSFYKDHAKESFYAVYSLEDGIRFIQEICYTGCLSSNGFKIANIGYNGDFSTHLFNINGVYGVAENTKSNRIKLAELSKNYGTIFTNSL